MNRYEFFLIKGGDSTNLLNHTIDSLVLPIDGIYQRYQFRFIGLRDDDIPQAKNPRTPTPSTYQGRIRVEVRLAKLQSRRNYTTPDFGNPRSVARAPKARLRQKNITHEIDLVPRELLKDHPDKPFRSTSVERGQVGIFIFRYSGAGMFSRLEFDSNSRSSSGDPQATPLGVLKDAYHVDGAKAFKGMAASRDDEESREARKLHMKRRRRSQSMDLIQYRRNSILNEHPLPTTDLQNDGNANDTAAVAHATSLDPTEHRLGTSLLGKTAIPPARWPMANSELERADLDESGLLVEQHEVMRSTYEQMKAKDTKLVAIGEDIERLLQQVETLQKEAAAVREKRDELGKRLEELKSCSQRAAASMQAELDKQQELLNFKKSELKEILEMQEKLVPSKRARDSVD